jgi:hypothetical protein
MSSPSGSGWPNHESRRSSRTHCVQFIAGPNKAKKRANSSREGNRGRLKSSFLGFIHFPRKRTLSGWALLFAMGKVTSDDFLCDREHVRVWKCRKTRTKVRSKSGQKWVSRVQSRWVQNDEMSILPGSMVGEGTPKKRAKIRPKRS